MSSARVATAVLISSSFAREGIKSYLEGSEFKLLDLYPVKSGGHQECPELIISTPNDLSQSEAIKSYISSNPDAKLMLLCQADAVKYLSAHIVRSASGILDCEIDRKTLLNALNLAMSGIAVHSSRLMELIVKQALQSDQLIFFGNGRFTSDACSGSASLAGQPSTKRLSPAEIKVLKCLAEGSSNKVIALRHCLAEATVKIHVKNILRKLNAQNRTQAAIWARENAVHFHGFGEAADRSHVPL